MKAFGGLGELKLRLCTMEKFKLKRSNGEGIGVQIQFFGHACLQ